MYNDPSHADLLPAIAPYKPYNVRETATLIGCSPQTVRVHCVTKAMLAHNFGTKDRCSWRIYGKEIARYLLHGPRQEAE